MDKHGLILYNISRRLKSRYERVRISSSMLGQFLGVSQQTASRYLRELEDEGLIKRSRSGRVQEIRITDKGINLLNEIYINLKSFLEKPLIIKGTVTTGIGEGAYYVREYMEKFREKIEFEPFPGTLNLRVERIPYIEKYISGVIEGFERDGRSFGNIGFIPVRLIVGDKKEDCLLIIPERTHHKDEIEIISRFNLRKKFNLKDGDSVKVEIIS
ncbi:MAG: riboflavin kinase [Candidatus Altiarchaeales archaeon]|nr:MAG: riboflavin kinase [Candidatus Altiarchaeales archaeon]RLI93935.1 MAG: riboflavin kinase [Candidatus Altiarchaeales archaeon]RLI94112.1 MAG: riboflavin kinase [Candidatus Altiarchaeales archaeon]HDO82390.1 CTP-dependent riboflavin kinase [Candidatus Altiarchaeales archaeon]HEX55039.1 CTP-dependent riboflavin kinase [Candidatus Altiarchaeales archaeon]